MAMEILNKANGNYHNRLGSEKYNSNLPEIQSMIASTYKNIELYNYVTNGNLMPDLTEYATYYDASSFENFARQLEMQSVNVQSMGMIR